MGDNDAKKSREPQVFNADSFAAILLAGGISKRMGEANKLLLTLDGHSFLQRAVASLINTGVREVVVVLGHESESMRVQLEGFNVRIVVNSEYKQGQMTSVQSGLSALSGEHQAVLISLSDQPLVSADHIKHLLSAFASQPSGKEILVPTYKNQRGNPIVISEGVRRQVLEGGRHPGCRRFIDANPELVNWLVVDDAAYTTDIDTPEEYLALQQQSHSSENRQSVGNATK